MENYEFYAKCDRLVSAVQSGYNQAIADLCDLYGKMIHAAIWRAMAIVPDLCCKVEDLRTETYSVMEYLVRVYDPIKSRFCAYTMYRLHFQYIQRGWKLLGRNTIGRGFSAISLDELSEQQDSHDTGG